MPVHFHKIRHYNNVIKPVVLYTIESLLLHTKGDLENILKEKGKIVRKTIGQRFKDKGCRIHSRVTTKKLSNLAADIRIRRLKF